MHMPRTPAYLPDRPITNQCQWERAIAAEALPKAPRANRYETISRRIAWAAIALMAASWGWQLIRVIL